MFVFYCKDNFNFMFETFKLTDQSIIDKPSAKNANDTTRNLRLIVLDVQHVKNFNLNLNRNGSLAI